MALLIIGNDVVQDYYREARKQAAQRDIRLWPDVGRADDVMHALA